MSLTARQAGTVATRTRALLLDLDGTLADTAPDMAAALNRLRASNGLAALSFEHLRPHVSSGARGMLGAGMGLKPDNAEFAALRDAFLASYESALCVESRLFEGMDQVLAACEARGLPWGVVTNKATRFALPLLAGLGLRERAACIVCGDTTPYAKPHPAPLLHACEALQLPAGEVLYVGDDLRDILAARAAGMRSLGARYGYLGIESPPEAWGADALIDHPLAILGHL